MPQWDFDRNITSMRLMTEWAEQQGCSLSSILAGTGVSETELQDPPVLVSAGQELQLIQNLVTAFDNRPGLGILVGQHYHFTVFGALGFAMISSRSMREALDLGLRYFDLTFAFTRFEILESASEVKLIIHDEDIPLAVRRFIVERDCACFVTLVRDIFSSVSVFKKICFSCSEPAELRAFGVPLVFAVDHNQIVLDRKQLESPLVQANDLARQSAEQQCKQLLENRRPRSGLSAKIRNLIAEKIAGSLTMEEIAADLQMNPRTLRRRLNDEGVSYVELRDEVRQTLAGELLSVTTLPIEQIASRLGYAESTSFINAFRRWQGLTPHAWRMKQGRGG